ncbi:tyrosine-type recombinase/integrase [Paraburkholderia hayleyella]|uniref:tyrosine-type recombinase/integrase n=1 Tax=Paraburkholderia hayleyella TaxID=2152889 RepID=UPI001292855A|nr:tyrosine-type recombinase/integrase [Paraburkholderia hayleyella]
MPSNTSTAISQHTPTDLFNQKREDWYLEPRIAFDTWLAQQRFRHSSADVYRAQWGLFLDWLNARHKTLLTVDTPTIAHFVAGLSIRKPQRVRYLRLIERVLDHVRAIEFASSNPARFIAQDGEATWRNARNNDPTGFLSVTERAMLVEHLRSPLPDGLSASQRWKTCRDRALIAVFLGAGVKVGEAKNLTVSCISCVEETSFLRVTAAHPAFTRQIRLLPFAACILERWLAERRLRALSGELLFPASPSGRPMHKATVLRAVDTLVEDAGISPSRTQRASPQTLRNSFAASLFDDGADPEEIKRWLGFVQPVSVARLHLAWKCWQVQCAEPSARDSLPDAESTPE